MPVLPFAAVGLFTVLLIVLVVLAILAVASRGRW